MLLSLFIKNLVLVDDLSIELGAGLNVLTGETGAGKSVLLEALGLVLGERAETQMIRLGQDYAEVQAVFDLTHLPDARHWLETAGFEVENECLLRRSIRHDGRSRATINGQPATVRQLQALGEKLMLIHAQHSYQALLQVETQQALFDSYGELMPHLDQVRRCWLHWRAGLLRWEQLHAQAQQRVQQRDWLDFQLQALAQLDLRPETYAQLQAEALRLGHLQDLTDACHHAQGWLDESEPTHALRCLNQARLRLQGVRVYAPELDEVVSLIDQATLLSQEASAQLRAVLRTLEPEPVREAEVAEHLAAWQAAARKHRVTPDALPALYLQLQHQRQQLQREETSETDLAEVVQVAQKDYQEYAEKLSQLRHQVLPVLAQQVNAELQALGLESARFGIVLQATAAGPEGRERVLFHLSANPGQPLTPLAKTASGGELTRVSLAIQTAAACRLVQGPSLVFDEVDVGVGGRVAELVGHKLLDLARGHRQVICVTHQAQVAALGHWHYQVSKVDGCTRLRLLSQDERETELARMLGGVVITPQLRSHAQALLQPRPS